MYFRAACFLEALGIPELDDAVAGAGAEPGASASKPRDGQIMLAKRLAVLKTIFLNGNVEDGTISARHCQGSIVEPGRLQVTKGARGSSGGGERTSSIAVSVAVSCWHVWQSIWLLVDQVGVIVMHGRAEI